MDRGATSNYILKEDVHFGTVKIADEVVAMIAGLAASEVEGVHSMAGNMGNDLLVKFGYKNLTTGVKVDIIGKEVKAKLAIVVEYGFNIPKVSAKAQEKVKQAIESMTGLTVTDVDIKVAGVNVQGR